MVLLNKKGVTKMMILQKFWYCKKMVLQKKADTLTPHRNERTNVSEIYF